MEYSIDILTTKEDYEEIQASITALVQRGGNFLASFYPKEHEVEDNDDVVIINGEYQLIAGTIKKPVSESENLEYADDYDIELWHIYKKVVIQRT